MKPLLLALAACSVLCASPAFAQSAGAADAPAAQAVDSIAARTALARRYFNAIEFTKVMRDMMEQLLPHVIEAKGAGMSADERAMIQEVVIDSMEAIMPRFIELASAKAAEVYTYEELKALADLFDSPLGRSITAKGERFGNRVDGLMDELNPMLEQEIETRICARMDCKPKGRRA